MAEKTASTEVDVIDDSVVTSGVTDVAGIIAGLNNPASGFYSSIKSDSFTDKLAIASAMTTSLPLDEHLDSQILLKDFIVQPVDLANDKGEITTAPRIVLVAADGTAYHATSVGILSSLRNVVSVLGEPSTWDAAIAVKVVRQKGNNGYSFFTLKFV